MKIKLPETYLCRSCYDLVSRPRRRCYHEKLTKCPGRTSAELAVTQHCLVFTRRGALRVGAVPRACQVRPRKLGQYTARHYYFHRAARPTLLQSRLAAV